jgi:uncharacterized membrane protein
MAYSRPMRLLRHLAKDHNAVNRLFPSDALSRIEQAIAASERIHRGQICVAIEAALPATRVLKRLAPRERALEVFGLLRVWDTEENVGVLIYVLLADRVVEIVADRGIHRAVGDQAWQAICGEMQKAFAVDKHADAVLQGVERVAALLVQHFPGSGDNVNELRDQPVIL